MKRFACDDYKKVLKDILDYYYSNVRGDYIPAIINEGALFSPDGFENNDLYMKIIAVKKGTKLDGTWFLDNLSSHKRFECFNYIVEYKYLRNNIYGIHQDLLASNDVSFCKQDNDAVLSLEYLDSDHKINGDRILISDEKNIFILFPFIREYTDKKTFPYDDLDYDLYVEIEYRTYDENLKPNRVGKFGIKNGLIDLTYEDNDAGGFKKDSKKLYWLRATVKLDTNRLFNSKVQAKKKKLNLGVVDLETRSIRELNPDNFDDDMHAGLLVFSNAAIDCIKQYYYFYDLYLIPKSQNVDSCLIDVFDDFIVFWEGEFNSNLPFELKQQIVGFNLTNITEHFISEPMYQSQLMGQWDIYKYLLPNQKLAKRMREKYKERSFETGIDFYPPRNIEEYSDFIKKVFNITNLFVEGLRISVQNKELLQKIINCKHTFESKEAMYNNYQGLCLLFLRELGFNDEEE